MSAIVLGNSIKAMTIRDAHRHDALVSIPSRPINVSTVALLVLLQGAFSLLTLIYRI